MSIPLQPVIAEADGRRVKILRFPETAIIALASEEPTARAMLLEHGVPEEVLVADLRRDPFVGVVDLLLTHPRYQLVPWGAEAPMYFPGDAALIPAS